MAEESEACGYSRRVLAIPGQSNVFLVLTCNRPAHEDGTSSQSMSGKRGNHRAVLVEGVVVYFETEKSDEASTK